MKAKIVSCLLVITLVLASTNFCNVAMALQDNSAPNDEPDVETIVHSVIEGTNTDRADELIPADGIAMLSADNDEIELVDYSMDTVSVADAAESVFDFEGEDVSVDSAQEVTAEDGFEYKIETLQTSESSYTRLYSEDKSVMSVTSVEGDEVKTEVYAYSPETKTYERQVAQFIVDDVALDECAFPQSIKYGAKYSCGKDFGSGTYWYQVGANKEKTYLKIGCKASYRIRTDNLSVKKTKQCDNYTSAVRKAANKHRKAVAYSVGLGASSGFVASIVIANIVFPPSILVTLVCSTLGLGGVAGSVNGYVNNMSDCYEYYTAAASRYKTIRTYGTKL